MQEDLKIFKQKSKMEAEQEVEAMIQKEIDGKSYIVQKNITF